MRRLPERGKSLLEARGKNRGEVRENERSVLPPNSRQSDLPPRRHIIQERHDAECDGLDIVTREH